ncbi:MAG: hypothetical protein OQJ81_01610, partial [Melioribacteraceae bacterium]|nr:hypothetical protein [Melioribacteraceae bacterium]
MKKTNNLLKIIIFASISIFFSVSCTEDSPNEINTEKNAADIQEYISKLNYNPEEMLNVQETSGEEYA